MKKFFNVLSIAVMCFGLAACGGSKASEIIGTWEGTETMEGTEMVIDEKTITVDDGTKADYEYDTSAGTILVTDAYGQSETMDITVDGDKLTLKEGGTVATFNKKK